MSHCNTPKSVYAPPTQINAIEHLQRSVGQSNLRKIYTYRERKRNAMLGLCYAYVDEDRGEVYALGRLWLSLLDHTLWHLTHRGKIYFSINPHCYEQKLVGLCYEWHDFDRFLTYAYKLRNYQAWINEVVHDCKSLIESDVCLRTHPTSSDWTLSPASATFYNTPAVLTATVHSNP